MATKKLTPTKDSKVIGISNRVPTMEYVEKLMNILSHVKTEDIVYIAGIGNAIKNTVDTAEIVKRLYPSVHVVYGATSTFRFLSEDGWDSKDLSVLTIGLSRDKSLVPQYEGLPLKEQKEATSSK